MKTIFELNIKMPYDPDVYENMKTAAFDLLSQSDKEKYTQAIVLYSANGNKYDVVIKNACSEDRTEEKEFLAKLKAAEDTEIRYVLCMWPDNCIDIPSFAFRKMLSDLDSKNQEALLFVMTVEGVSAMKISSSLH